MVEPVLRRATAADVPAIVALLADDELGRTREGGDASVYAAAFAEIEADRNTVLYVIDIEGEVAGCAQLTIVPGLSHRGMKRAEIEGVRVAATRRGEGLGRWLIEALVRIAREGGSGMVQLTSNRRRTKAHRFYESLGFEPSHVGFKLMLE